MSQTDPSLRAKLIAQPEIVIDDRDVMRALIEATDARMGSNVLDMRSVAMDRLEQSIDRLENAHREVIAAAYDNQASMSQIHRAVLCLLEASTLDEFVAALTGDLCAILRVDSIHLILETVTPKDDIPPHRDGLVFADPGVVATYITGHPDQPSRHITLRQISHGDRRVYGANGPLMRSEACLYLEAGHGHAPGLLLIGSQNPQKFLPQMGTDLLAFLGQVVELSLRRLLA